MGGFGRVEEERRRAGGGEGGGDLLPDQAGLAHPGNDHTRGRGEDQLHRFLEALVQPLKQTFQRFQLGLQHPPRNLETHGGNTNPLDRPASITVGAVQGQKGK